MGAEVLTRAEAAEPRSSCILLVTRRHASLVLISKYSAETAASPKIGDKEILDLKWLTTTYALAHRLLYLPVGDVHPQPQHRPPQSTSLVPFPTPYPRPRFLLAQKLQPLFNILFARVATDEKFSVMDGVDGVRKVNLFTGWLWGCWELAGAYEGSVECSF